MNLAFTGTAVYVMSIAITTTSLNQIAPLSNSQLSFQINGTNVGSFNKTAPVGLEVTFGYDSPVFVQEGLPLGRHNLTIINGGPSKSLFLLDRIIYT